MMRSLKKFATFIIVAILPVDGVAQSDEASKKLKDALRQVVGATEVYIKSSGEGLALDAILRNEEPPSEVQTFEEEGFRNYFAELDRLAFINAYKAVAGEPGQRNEALAAMVKGYDEWYETLSQTLPPERMNAKGLNVRESLLKLLQHSKNATNSDQITEWCVQYLRRRADYNAFIRSRDVPQERLSHESETRFTFRPGGNAAAIIAGNGALTDIQFRLSWAIPTSLGGIVIWQQEKTNAYKYIVVEYRHQLRFLRLANNCEVTVEDKNTYRTSLKARGDYLILTISTDDKLRGKSEKKGK